VGDIDRRNGYYFTEFGTFAADDDDDFRCRYICYAHPLSVISENITISHISRKLDTLRYISVADSTGLTSAIQYVM